MRSPAFCETIQIELTSRCERACSNCTRFVGHRATWDMPKEQIIQALDSLKGYRGMVGCMGGEPTLSPNFEFFCEEALKRFPREKLGLWSAFPESKKHYAELICRTFYHVFLNDHSRPDIYHAPLLVGAREAIEDEGVMWLKVDQCWIQNSWSASINPNGAWFCEVAAALSLLFDEPATGWKVEPGWWKRIPKDFTAQMEQFCPRCGGSLSLPRRASQDGRDDISLGNLEALQEKSLKLRQGKYVISDLREVKQPEEMAAYKDPRFRDRIAARYGIFLTVNEYQYNEPHLLKSGPVSKVCLFEQFKQKYA